MPFFCFCCVPAVWVQFVCEVLAVLCRVHCVVLVYYVYVLLCPCSVGIIVGVRCSLFCNMLIVLVCLAVLLLLYTAGRVTTLGNTLAVSNLIDLRSFRATVRRFLFFKKRYLFGYGRPFLGPTVVATCRRSSSWVLPNLRCVQKKATVRSVRL